ITLNPLDRKNKFQQIVSPNPEDAGMWIHQNAWFNLGTFDGDMEQEYKLHDTQNGVYAFVIKGSVTINGQSLDTRDGLGIWNTEVLNIKILVPETEVLLIEVPMQL